MDLLADWREDFEECCPLSSLYCGSWGTLSPRKEGSKRTWGIFSFLRAQRGVSELLEA